MGAILEKYREADLVLWSFPLYIFGAPSKTKALMDRLLPLNLPEIKMKTDGGAEHPARYDLAGQRHILISTCGFFTIHNNYDALLKQFDILFDSRYTKILCPQGELFRVPEMHKRTGEYLSIVKQAGAEYAAGGISDGTTALLDVPLYPAEVFTEMANASWNVAASGQETPDTPGVPDAGERFTRQMAALYRPGFGGGKEQVLEFYYTDVDKTYQILLNDKGHTVLTSGFVPYTTRIETPLALWQDIARGKLSGQTALMQRKYRVLGDFDLMLHWDDYFSGGTAQSPAGDGNAPAQKKTNLTVLLAPWIVIWIALAIHPLWGGVLGILVSAAMPFLWMAFRATIFERVSILLVSGISLAALLSVNLRLLLPLSYGLFGLLWFITVFMKIPLTAWYSQNAYGGEKALSNPLFLHTNRILTACWGALYLLTPIWTWAVMGTPAARLTGYYAGRKYQAV
jgi:hypothetical protein